MKFIRNGFAFKKLLKRHLDYYHSIGRQYVKNCNKHICMLYLEILYNFKYWIIFVDFFHKWNMFNKCTSPLSFHFLSCRQCAVNPKAYTPYANIVFYYIIFLYLILGIIFYTYICMWIPFYVLQFVTVYE